jgi:hypothetical protein
MLERNIETFYDYRSEIALVDMWIHLLRVS